MYPHLCLCVVNILYLQLRLNGTTVKVESLRKNTVEQDLELISSRAHRLEASPPKGSSKFKKIAAREGGLGGTLEYCKTSCLNRQ